MTNLENLAHLGELHEAFAREACRDVRAGETVRVAVHFIVTRDWAGKLHASYLAERKAQDETDEDGAVRTGPWRDVASGGVDVMGEGL